MVNEANSDLSHHELRDYLALYLRDQGATTYTEQPLPNGRIADLLCIWPTTDIEIVEVKTELRDSTIAAAWDKYHCYAHRLWIAVPPHISLPVRIPVYPTSWRTPWDDAGVITVDRVAHQVLRTAVRRRPHHLAVDQLHDLIGWG